MTIRHADAETAQRQPVAVRGEKTTSTGQAAPGCAEKERVSQLQAAIDESPRMAAQRRAIQAAFGVAVQLRADGPKDDELLQARAATAAQRIGVGDEDKDRPVQGRFDGWAVQGTREGVESGGSAGAGAAPVVNQTGLPDQLKAGIEALSGMDMSGVRVHRNSDKPAQLSALAFAQGNHIHLGSGQEQHLPHEAWHVVQQRQGRVRETVQMAGVGVNDDVGLEREADLMGEKAESGLVQLKGVGKRQDPTTAPCAAAPKFSLSFSDEHSANQNPRARQAAQLQSVVQGNWKHWALGALGGGALVAVAGAALPFVAGAAGLGALAGGIYSHIAGGEQEAPYRFGDNVSGHYQVWDESQQTNMPITSRGGISLNARHNRGAPYVTKPGVGDTYTSFLHGTAGGADDRAVAHDLLHGTSDAIRTEDQQNNAAMMEAVVGLAEEWRKHGAAWLYRAILRGVKAGKWTLAQVPKLFAFVKSANSGRRQVARIQDVKAGRLKEDALVGDEKDIVGYGSDIDDDGFDSDEEVRLHHGMKGRRLFSTKYDQ